MDLVRIRLTGTDWVFNIAVTFNVLNKVLLCLLVLCQVPSVALKDGSGTQIVSNNPNLDSNTDTLNLSNLSSDRFNLLKDMLKLMEDLNMFINDANDSRCFHLEKVVRNIKSPGTSSRKLELRFYFEGPDSNTEQNPTLTPNGNAHSNQFKYGNENLLMTESCDKSQTLPDIYRLYKLSRKQDDKNQKSTNTSSSNINLTEPLGAQHMDDENLSQEDKNRGLSRTQVIVISTCSAVMGTFFIIAGAMRIHYCLKRQRARREAAAVIDRRTSPFGFGGSGNVRRDSACSKASRQQNCPASKTGSDVQVDKNGRSQHQISHNSPEHISDHNPLLPVQLEGKFSERSNSSHGSLAFIDEESHGRSKLNDHHSGSDIGSEDDPLLRKSPDSGSSLDISFADDKRGDVGEEDMEPSLDNTNLGDTENKSTTHIPTSPNREVVFEPGGESDLQNNVNIHNDRDDDDKWNLMKGRNLKDDEPYVTDSGNDQIDSPKDCINMESYNDGSACERSKEVPGVTPESLTTSELPTKNNKYPYKQFSVDYFDVDDNGIEIKNPIFEDINEMSYTEGLSENKAVTTGLTQSDNSLSNNPSYCYGNQTEYDNFGGYGQIGYYCPYNSISNDIKWFPVTSIQNSLRNSMILSAETLRRENGNSIRDNVDDGNIDSSGKLVEDFHKAKCPRMYSTESYFANSMNRLSPFERSYSTSPDDTNDTCTANTDSTISTRKLHIVPLEEYNRSTLKETIEEDDVV